MDHTTSGDPTVNTSHCADADLNRHQTRTSVKLASMNALPGPTALQQLVEMFASALSSLGAKPTNRQLEDWSVLVHEAMSSRGRSFHTTDHVFEIAEGAPALPALASIFHDVVYVQIDGGLPARLQAKIGDATVAISGTNNHEIATFDPVADRVRAMVLSVFGFKPKQVLTPFSGLNEFLSALLAARLLSEVLDFSTIARITTCIEATIPFRPITPAGETPFDLLYRRLVATNESFSLDLTDDDIRATIHSAVDISNRDLGNFAYEDTASFLDNTWKLLPESNASLRSGSVYTVREYRVALQKMEAFMSGLDSSRVFHGFDGAPERPRLTEMIQRAGTNLRLGTVYLRTKLIAAAVLEALAEATGGDAPIELFMGELPEKDRYVVRMEDFLPQAEVTASDVEPTILRLMLEGRASETGFDLKHSPIAGFMYPSLGTEGVERALDVARKLFQGQATAVQFLGVMPKHVVKTIAESCARIAITRADDLRTLASHYE